MERWNIVDTQVRKSAEIVHQKGEEVACLLFQKPWAVGGGLFSLAKDTYSISLEFGPKAVKVCKKRENPQLSSKVNMILINTVIRPQAGVRAGPNLLVEGAPLLLRTGL